jgi:hypothetical protein
VINSLYYDFKLNKKPIAYLIYVHDMSLLIQYNEITCIFSTREEKYIFKKYVKLTAGYRYCIRIYTSGQMVRIFFGVFENRPPTIGCYSTVLSGVAETTSLLTFCIDANGHIITIYITIISRRVSFNVFFGQK